MSNNSAQTRLTVTTVRVYGSQSRYGAKPRESLTEQPLRLKGFPRVGDKAEVHLGPPVEWVFQADRVSRAVGAAALEGFFGPTGANGALESRVAELIRDPALTRDRAAYEWYVTLAVSHDAVVPTDQVKDRTYVWLEPDEAMRVEREERRIASPALDVIAATLATAINEFCFESIVLDDTVYFSLSGRQTFRLPNFRMGDASLTMRGGTVDMEAVTRAFETSRAVARDMSGAAYWRLAAIRETDQWKRFDWTFLALEILVNKLAPRFYALVTDRLRSESEAGVHRVPDDTLVLPLERLSLVAKFTLVALALRPESAAEDVERFRAVKRARDQMSHGAFRETEQLPTGAVTQLLAEYFRAAVHNLPAG